MTTKSIRIEVEMDAAELARQLSAPDAFNFIVQLDEQRGDWNFTLRLCEHFDRLRGEHAMEQVEDEVARTAARR